MQAPRPTSVKWIARAVYGLVFVAVVSASWWALREDPPAPSVTVPEPVPVRAREPKVVEVVEAPPPPEEPERALPPPDALAPPVLSTPRPPKHPVDARESGLLDRARSLVQADPEAALKALAEHRQAFPSGALLPDAELVHVEALLRLGRREEAEKLGKKLVARDRSGTLSRSVERLLADVRSN